jgi:hypothetical protein
MNALAEPDVAEDDATEEMVLDLVGRLRAAEPALSAVGAAVMIALHLGIASDSRTFSRLFGIEHALVLREVTELTTDADAFLAVIHRNARTQRTALALTDKASELISRVI